MTNILTADDFYEHYGRDTNVDMSDWSYEALCYRLLPDGRWQYKSFDTGFYWETRALEDLPDVEKCRCDDAQFVHYEVINKHRVHMDCPHCIKEREE